MQKLRVVPDGTPGRFKNTPQTRWASAVTGVLEFHRVLADLFPNGSKLLRLATTGGRFLTQEWGDRLISYKNLTNALDRKGPERGIEASAPLADGLKSGLTMSIEALKMPDQNADEDRQVAAEKIRAAAELRPNDDARLRNVRPHVQQAEFAQKPPPATRNCGTVVLFTSVYSLDELRTILRNAESVISELNYNRFQLVSEVPDIADLEVDAVRLFLIHEAVETCNSWRGRIKPTIFFSSQKIPMIKIVHKILNENYGVSATVVQNIPMKDENERRSINYNVEVFHHRKAHSFFRRLGFFDANSPIVRAEDEYPTVHLRWSGANNRFNAKDPPLFNHSCLSTVAYVRDRAAICISNFVLGGKHVLLDMDANRLGGGIKLPPTFFGSHISHFFSLDFNTDGMLLNCVEFCLKVKHKASGRSTMPKEVLPAHSKLFFFEQQTPRPIFVEQLRRIDHFSRPTPAVPLANPPPAVYRSRSSSPVVKRARYAKNWVEKRRPKAAGEDGATSRVRRNSNGPVAQLYPNLKPQERSVEPPTGVRPQRPPHHAPRGRRGQHHPPRGP
ncbi:Cell cycle regulator Mat89Bb [Aphelenchoides fujianensis]|nr:Cell cycle regulator Mat89Bb [Aphelenchoides fujianensis]